MMRAEGVYLEAAASPEGGLHRVVASTETRDRNQRMIIQAGWELANYRANPQVLWSHDSDSLPIGAGVVVKVGSHEGTPALLASLRFHTADLNPFAQRVEAMAAAKHLPGISVGWVPIADAKTIYSESGEYLGSDFPSSDLLEISVTPIPANPAALRLAASLEMPADEQSLFFVDAPSRLGPRAIVDFQRARVRAQKRSNTGGLHHG